METVEIKIGKGLNSARLDMALVRADVGLSRRKIREIIDVGGAYINGRRVRIASRPVHSGDIVKIQYNLYSLRKLKNQVIKLDPNAIIFEDERMIAINKPPGLASQETRDQARVHVVPCVKQLLKEMGRVEIPHLILVHRLDMETSGVMLLAKDEIMATYLGDLFRNKEIKKKYLAIAVGIPKWKMVREECYLSAIQPKSGVVKKVHSGGKSSRTDFQLLATDVRSGLSLINCLPHTGRSHQIRVHLQNHNLPILGDKKYTSPAAQDLLEVMSESLKNLAADHHLLHASQLEFINIGSEQKMNLSATLPENFTKILDELGWSLPMAD